MGDVGNRRQGEEVSMDRGAGFWVPGSEFGVGEIRSVRFNSFPSPAWDSLEPENLKQSFGPCLHKYLT